MADTYNYRFESFLYPAHVSRIELEAGKADMHYIRRRHHQLANERGEQVMPTIAITAVGITSVKRSREVSVMTTTATALTSCRPTAMLTI